MTRKLATALMAVFVLAGAAPQPLRIPTPSEFLKLEVGADGVLADWEQIVSYWRAIDRLTDRITVQDLGQTTMGHPYIVAIITSPENQKRLEYYRELNNRLYDPRRTSEQDARRLIAEGKTIIAVQGGIHSTEVGAPQLSMELAYRFATEHTPRMQEVLDNTIVILSPSHNPDGTQLVAEWNRKTVRTRFEGATVPFLYHKYVGHDNNRDWYMFTQIESRITVAKIWNYWHPEISYDLHEMSPTGARMFMPPYIDPTDPNVDPILRAQLNALGTAVASDLTAQGKAGVVVHALYDLWTPARAYTHYHGGARFLTEVASARLASPITLRFEQLSGGIGYDPQRATWNFPRPWRGGTWRLRDILDYEHAALSALLDHATKYRELWLTNFWRVNKHAVGREPGKPAAIVVPAGQADPASTYQMLWILQFGDVEISRARAPFTADRRQFQALSHVIQLSQPAGAFAKTLTEVQHYPDMRRYPGGPTQKPYDVTAYTLPLLMGVDTATIQAPFEADLERVPAPIAPPAGTVAKGLAKTAYVMAHNNAALMALPRLLKAGLQVKWAVRPFGINGRQFKPGTFVVPVAGREVSVHQTIAAIANSFPVEIFPLNEPAPPATSIRLPRVALYKALDASVDEGWTRWLFEQWELPYRSLGNKEVRAGNLREKYDAIVLPDQQPGSILHGFLPGTMPDEYVGGIEHDGVAALRAFVETGGTLVTLNAASLLAVQQFALPVRNTLEGISNAETGQASAASTRSNERSSLDRRLPTRSTAARGTTIGSSSGEFYGPGLIVRTLVEEGHPITFGSDPEGIAWFEHSPAFEVSGNARALVTYPKQGSPLLSGWLLGGHRLSGKAAVVEAPLGRGRVVLFGFRPQYRAQTWSTFKLLFNALYYAAMDRGLGSTQSVGMSAARVSAPSGPAK